MRTPLRAVTALTLSAPLALAFVSPSVAAPGRHKSTDTQPPAVAIAAPTGGSTTTGAFTASGSASDNYAVSTVAVALDGGAWQAAVGTTSWSLPISGATSGTHTLAARASDSSGNTTTSSVSFSVATASSSPSPTPSPTASPSPSPTSSPSPSPSPTSSPTPSPTSTTSTTAPDTQGTWKSPEGATIIVNTAGPWTIAKVYSMLTANALELSTIGPNYTVNVQDQYSSMTTTIASGNPGAYTSYSATTYLKAVNSTFATWPDYVLAHEYGIAWSQYHLYMTHGGDWAAYLGARWDTADGSVTLGQDSRLYSSQTWQPAEIIADDYRLLFGSSLAISERNYSINTTIPDPRNQAGLGSWLLNTWA